ncbi:hypothetical protein V8E55_001223 [Tylopilus felleus]
MFHARHATAFARQANTSRSGEFNMTARSETTKTSSYVCINSRIRIRILFQAFTHNRHRHERPSSKLVRRSVAGFRKETTRRTRTRRWPTSPNTTFSRSLSRSLNTTARLAPPLPRRSPKTLISRK